MADILTFPAHPQSAPAKSPALTVVPETTRHFVHRQLTYAGNDLSAALLDITGAAVFIIDGEEVGQSHGVFEGETLESVLQASLYLMNVRGVPEDDDARRAIRAWLNRREAEHG